MSATPHMHSFSPNQNTPFLQKRSVRQGYPRGAGELETSCQFLPKLPFSRTKKSSEPNSKGFIGVTAGPQVQTQPPHTDGTGSPQVPQQQCPTDPPCLGPGRKSLKPPQPPPPSLSQVNSSVPAQGLGEPGKAPDASRCRLSRPHLPPADQMRELGAPRPPRAARQCHLPEP